MPLDYKENEEDFFHLKILNDNLCRFLTYRSFLEETLKDNPLALRVFSRMMFLMKPKDEDRDKFYDVLIEMVTKTVVSRFKDNKRNYAGYYFSEKRRVDDIPDLDEPFGKEYYETLTFESMVRDAVREYKYLPTDTPKEVFYEICYKSIDGYTRKHEVIRQKYNHYKINCLVAYIAMKLNYNISEKLCGRSSKNVEPTNNELDNAINYWTNNYCTY